MTPLRLSALQREVVSHGEGALLVFAGPGSGKTRVLTERVRRLIKEVPGHFRVLALTFTNRAANEMKERLKDLSDLKSRAFIGTMHGFCLDLLLDRGKPVGVGSDAQIFENYVDRKQILLDAVASDPLLSQSLSDIPDEKNRNKRLDDWLKLISTIKAHPVTMSEIDDPSTAQLLDAYNAGLRACNAYDFDDLLLLTYRLLTEYSPVADFYRRLYGFVCIDEAQDLNEAQYQVIKALCGDTYKNVMMVGDPKQSIYGFNTSSSKYMDIFSAEFQAKRIELTENYRSARSVVDAARSLEPTYQVSGQLPVKGLVQLAPSKTEAEEANVVANKILHLMESGHPDVEGPITPSRCAVLGRTRFVLLPIEKEFEQRKIPFYKRISPTHENASDLIRDFVLALRVVANPKDTLHLTALAARWKVNAPVTDSTPPGTAVLKVLDNMQKAAGTTRAKSVVESIAVLVKRSDRVELVDAIRALRSTSADFEESERVLIYEDTEVLLQEWDHFLRSGGKKSSIAAFMSGMSLGTSQNSTKDGVALLTVHSSKGLEFDVLFVVGMADGIFPDFRARGNGQATIEERRNAFVAITRSKRLLFLSYAQERIMPWGDTWIQKPSPYLSHMGCKST